MLGRIDEYEFVQRLHLPRAIKHPSGINFECVYCNEGKSKGHKRRAYILSKSNKYDHIVYYCQNCGKSVSLRNFLKDYDSSLFDEYLIKERNQFLDNLKTKKSIQRSINIVEDIDEVRPNYIELSENEGFIPAYKSIEAKNYCKKRKIPYQYFKTFYYNDAIVVKSKQGKTSTYYKMLVMPFYNGQNIYGYQARSIQKKTFYTFSQPGFKVYNIFNIDFNRRVYVFESIIDSLFFNNSIAMVSASLSKEWTEKLKDFVFILDNDRTKDTYNRLEKLIDGGYRVVIWPEDFSYKDVNEAIMSGMTINQLETVINTNIYNDVYAKIRLKILKSKRKKS